jgi:DNA-binding NarL/FixJ family response regulator
MIRVLLCDDHLIVRQGLRQLLGDSGDVTVVAEADNGPDVLRRVREASADAPIDVVLLDIAMPGRDGLDVLAQLKAEFPSLPVLMLSTYPDRQYAVRCLKLGASGYLNKSADAEQIVAAVRQAAGGGLFVTPQVAEALVSNLGQPAGGAPHEALSTREDQVFRLLAQGRSVGAIAAELSLSPNTVSTYRARVLEKTGAANDVELALYAVRHKLLAP